MRWFVEISSLGASEGPKQKWCIEAAGWQPALKETRALRGEEGPLGGFSVELLDDGARAVDPASRVRYVIREAPADAPLTHTKAGPIAAPAAKSEPAPAAKSEPAPAAKSEPVKSAPPAAPAPAPVAAPTPAPAAAAANDDDVDIPVDTEDGEADATARSPSLPAFQLLHSREEDPTEKSPLTYREHVYAVDGATTDEEIERLLRERFEAVKEKLAGTKAGRFVNLAIFDHVFTGKPAKRPRATLAWKDWRGTPEIRFPSADRGSLGPPSFSAPTSASQSVPPPSLLPAEPSAAKPSVPPATEVAPTEPAPTPIASTERAAAAIEGATADAPTVVAPSMDAATVVAPSTAVPVPKIEAPRIDVPAEASVARPSLPVSSAPRTMPAVVPSRREAYIPKVKTAAEAGRRMSGDDLISELFEACGDLQFARDSLEGADFVLNLALEKLPSEVGLVSLFDINRREFVVVRQAGGPRSVVLARLPERAGLAQPAMRKKAAIVVPHTAKEPRALDDRFRTLGVEQKSLMVAPVEQSGRYLGLIELLNPIDGRAFTEGDGNALTYIGEQFAEFVAERGILLDPDTVLERHQKR